MNSRPQTAWKYTNKKERKMLKDLFYIGLGGALLAKEKVEKELNELVEKGKLNKEEAQKLIDKAKAKGEEEEEEFKAKLKEAIQEVLEEMDLATKSDIEALKETKEAKKK
jgi:polyhydroxyalkanoate synthesis regulator phasin